MHQKIKNAIEALQVAINETGITIPFVVQICTLNGHTYNKGILIGLGEGTATIGSAVEYCGFGPTVEGAFNALHGAAKQDLDKAAEIQQLISKESKPSMSGTECFPTDSGLDPMGR